ncbi:hypothetical protein SUGI_1171420 [Cryptomeria japonica]|nr:hypothetical protein SUGI_1171420 [Cryptomeria japonica]
MGSPTLVHVLFVVGTHGSFVFLVGVPRITGSSTLGVSSTVGALLVVSIASVLPIFGTLGSSMLATSVSFGTDSFVMMVSSMVGALSIMGVLFIPCVATSSFVVVSRFPGYSTFVVGVLFGFVSSAFRVLFVVDVLLVVVSVSLVLDVSAIGLPVSSVAVIAAPFGQGVARHGFAQDASVA